MNKENTVTLKITPRKYIIKILANGYAGYVEKNLGDSVKYSQNEVKANVYNIRYSQLLVLTYWKLTICLTLSVETAKDLLNLL